ncbi:alpha-mannosidase I [Musa troglodytarum]|uniref:alpha-1,2-Mannosidase n=1 Tax=Musa troglodytarum TaxID=320322 RepID=A0A9E7L4C4_9LILI|nr:alpha-mannosidase I [Musa troglodytarum]
MARKRWRKVGGGGKEVVIQCQGEAEQWNKRSKKRKKDGTTIPELGNMLIARYNRSEYWSTVGLLKLVVLVVVYENCIFYTHAHIKDEVVFSFPPRFYHAYENYMVHAFPHDELKPLTKTFTDSLSELGNLKVLERLPQNYNGSALTLVESLSSLVVLGNYTEFERGVLWLSDNLTFDVDARVNLFECNIRVLGGLVSAHILATDSKSRLEHGLYKNQLLDLARDLGQRFLPAFETPTGLPYAWINLRYGVMDAETTETSTSGCGSLILEMGALSRLTGDPRFQAAALRALRKLWSMRSPLNLLGTTLDVVTGEWIEYSSGVGAGVDSFYEYLLKAYILFGNDEFWDMFHSSYLAVQKYFRHGPWYHEADMRTGKATYWQLTSLQAFWPGLQILVGDIAAANSSHREFFYVWDKFGVLPERYLLDHGMLHPTEKYYPLRPELAESTFYLYQATRGNANVNLHLKYIYHLSAVEIVDKLFYGNRSLVYGSWCKYLYLLFDDSFLAGQNYVFTTEGHPLPIRGSWHEKLPEAYIPANWTSVKVFHASGLLFLLSFLFDILSPHKLLRYVKAIDISIDDHGNNNTLIRRFPNPGRSLGHSASGGSSEGPLVMDSNTVSWHGNNVKEGLLGAEGVRLPTAILEERSRVDEETNKVPEPIRTGCSSSGKENEVFLIELRTRNSFSSIRALMESCARCSEPSTPLAAGVDMGINLPATVAAMEISKSVISPSESSGSSPAIEDICTGNSESKLRLSCDSRNAMQLQENKCTLVIQQHNLLLHVPAEVEGHNGGGATPLEDKLDTRGQVSGISTDGDGSDCTAASGRKLQKLLVEDPLSGPVVKEELGSASATDQQQLPSLDAVDESVVAVVSLAADNVPSPKAVDESMTRKSENSGIDYFKLGDEAREKNSIPTSSIDEPVGSATVSLVTAAIASETSGFNGDRRGKLASSTESCSSGVSAEPDVISKLEFDLNEGISGVDGNEEEPAISAAVAQQPLVHFGQQNHETFLEMPPDSSHMPPSYFARKQGCPQLDIDLNVAGEGLLEDMASESASQTQVSISGTLMTSSSHRLEAPILPTQPASGAFPGGEASVLRNFDVNDQPGADEVGSGPIPRSQKQKLQVIVQLFNPLVAIPVSLRILSVTGGGNSLNDDYRGSALSSSPAMTFASVTLLSYARLPFASGYPISSTSFSDGSTSPVSDNNLKWSRRGFDLNTGPGIGDMEAKDEKLSSASRQLLVATSEVFMDEQARTYGFPGVGLKRKLKGVAMRTNIQTDLLSNLHGSREIIEHSIYSFRICLVAEHKKRIEKEYQEQQLLINYSTMCGITPCSCEENQFLS